MSETFVAFVAFVVKKTTDNISYRDKSLKTENF
jgi:hypothetical protein